MKEQHRTIVLVFMILVGLGFIFFFDRITSAGF
jgi:hypothetical protein